MNIEKYLIILKGEDKTSDIKNYEYVDNWKVNVTFNKSNKTYGYSKSNFKFYQNPVELNIDNVEKKLISGDIYNVKKILRFDSYCKIIFEDNSTKLVNYYELCIDNKTEQISEDRFNYLKDISKIVSVRTDDGTALLTKEYETVNFVEKDTALYQYLNPKNLEINSNDKNVLPLIFPFGSNKSQYQAVKNAFNNRISVIEGPPGTGKTQTILNIVVNIVSRGKTVAVVSNNNEATANVYEKLRDSNYGYICAILGKKENKDKFIDEQIGFYPYIEKVDDVNDQTLHDIEKLNKMLSEVFELKNKKAVLKSILTEIETEHKYYEQYEKIEQCLKIQSLNRLVSDKIMRLKVEFEDKELKNSKVSFWLKLKAICLYGLGTFEFYKLPIKNIKESYNQIYYMVKEYELKKEISKIYEKLQSMNYENLMKMLVKVSNKYFRYILYKKYFGKTERKKYSSSDLKIHSDEFTKDYPVIFSTTYSIKESLNPNFKYDYIIMDESSQVDLITGTLALSCAKNAIIVGDRKQLSNVITNYDRKQIDEITEKYNIADSYNFLKECFLTSVIDSIPNVSSVLLKEHYRCNPKIIGFSNKKFYNNELVILTENTIDNDVMKVYVTSEGNHARGHYNQRQIEVIRDEILPELRKKVSDNQIGVASPYNDQKNGIIELAVDDSIKVDTVHKFQGREKDAMIITTVDNQISEFIDDPRLLNVAVTRAKKYLRLVVSKDICDSNSNLNDLIKYIQYNNFEVVNSKIKSIYDMLYKANREQRLKYLKDKKIISDYDSENITFNVIKGIIEKNQFNSLDVSSHVPIADLLNDMDKLEEDELKYASNDWTHIDFVIYNKMDKKMVLAIEVDGYYFHKQGTKQSERDKLKNKILSKYEIPLIRLSTIGSGEEKILEDKMKEIFGRV